MQCRNGHESTESDYCSVCGIAMPAATGAPTGGGSTQTVAGTAATIMAPAGETCPSCGEARTDVAARFCEVCRYDFQSGGQGPPPIRSDPDPPVAATVAPTTVPPRASEGGVSPTVPVRSPGGTPQRLSWD